jgi:putative tryptophan/tyrosine transport system substrate-binding protein
MQFDQLRRREFISLLGGAAAWPLTARAQQTIPIIESIYSVSAASWTDNMDAFRRGLAEVGFVDGRNVAIDYRWADGRIERMREFAADLIRRKVAVIVTGGATAGVRDVVTATKTVPIVFTTALDPVASGLVASLNRPGANVTGVTFIGSELVGKQLELLKELIPVAAKIATLVNPNNPVMAEGVIQNARTAARLGLDVIVIHASTESEIDAAFTSAVEQRTSALFAEDAYFASRGEQIAALGLRHRLPTFGVPQNVTAGMLMGYGANIPDSYRQAGIYVGRILKGEKPGDLPVLQPTKFSLVINLKTAKALGIDVPLFLQQRADEVIE